MTDDEQYCLACGQIHDSERTKAWTRMMGAFKHVDSEIQDAAIEFAEFLSNKRNKQ